MATTYAEAVETSTQENNATSTQENNATNVKNIRLQKRFILYKITPRNISTNEVIEDIANSLKVDAPTAIFGVHRDTRFKCRFTVIFKDSKFIQQIRQNGMKIGDTIIKPKNINATRGYLPNLPMYALEGEIKELLAKHGKILYLKARTRNDGIRIGGWVFRIDLKTEMPNNILYDNENFAVLYDEKPKIPPPPTQDDLPNIETPTQQEQTYVTSEKPVQQAQLYVTSETPTQQEQIYITSELPVQQEQIYVTNDTPIQQE